MGGWRWSLAVVFLVACGGDDVPRFGDRFGDAQYDFTAGQRLIILHTNDEHSRLFGWGPEVDDYPLPTTAGAGEIVGNIARRATLVDFERASATKAGSDLLLVSAGDHTQGALPALALTTSSPDLRMMHMLADGSPHFRARSPRFSAG